MPEKRLYPDERASLKKQTVNTSLCNILIQYGCKEIFIENLCYAAVLDSHSFQTSLALLQNNVVPTTDRILIPNPFEFDKMTEQIQNIPFLAGIQLRNEYSGKFLSIIKLPLGLLYLDYTCTLNGCKRVRPKSEINLLFKKRVFLSPSAFFAITLNIPRNYGNDTERAVTEAFSYISQVAESNSNTVIMLFNDIYNNVHSRMLFLVLQVQ